MSSVHHGLTTDTVIGFSDDELVDRLHAAISRVPDVSGFDKHDTLTDELYFLTDEIMERFSPEAAAAERGRSCASAGELKDALAVLRRKQAARLLRDKLGDSANG